MTAFGLAADQAGRFADVLAATANGANTNVSMLGESFKYVAPVAGALGYSIEDTAVALGLMANAGIKSSQAGTSLKTALTNMVNPSKKMAGEMKSLGINIKDSNGEMKPMDVLLRDLRKSFSKLTNDQKAASAATIFGKESMAGMLAVINASDEDFEKLSKSINNSTGAAERMAEEMQNNLEGQLTNLKSALAEIALVFGTALLPVFKKATEFAQELANKFNALDESTKTMIAIATALTAALALVAGPLLILVGLIPTIVSGITALGGAFALMTGPIGLTIAAIAAVVAALVLAYNKIEWFREIVDTVFNFIWDIISNIMSTVASFIGEKTSEMKEFFKQNMEGMREATQNVMDAIKTIIDVAMKVLTPIFKVAWEVIKMIVVTTWDAIKNVIDGALNMIKGIVNVFVGVFTADFSRMWEGVKQLFMGAIEFIWGLVNLAFIGRILKGVGAFVGTFKGLISGMWGTIRNIFTTTINAVLNIFVKGFNSMSTTASNITGIIKNVVQNGFNAMKNAISNAMSGAVGVVKDMFGKMLSTAKDIPSKFIQVGKDMISGLTNGIKNMAMAPINAITGVVDGVLDKAKSMLKIFSPSRVFRDDIGKMIPEGMAVGIDKNRKSAVNQVAKLSKDVMAEAAKGNKELQKVINANNAEISKINKRAAEDIAKIERTAASKKRKLTTDELIKIRRINEDAQKKIKDLEAKSAKERAKIEEDRAKLSIEMSTKYVDKQKELGNMGLRDEIYFWNAMYGQAKKGTAEYEHAMKNHQSAVAEMRKQVESINKEYTDKIIDIERKALDDIQKVHDEYNKMYSSRVGELTNFVGLLDEFKRNNEVAGKDIISNLESQVIALEDYGMVMESLNRRVKDDAFYEQLQSLGVKSLGELEAINSLSDKELDKLEKLFQKKFELATDRAKRELEPMKRDVEEQIQNINKSSQKELEVVKLDWQKSINGIVGVTKKEFDSMNKVGKDAIAGLEKGLESMRSPLMKTAKSIADEVGKTIAKALEIRSPSRLTMRMGVNVGEGLAIGIDKSQNDVAKSVKGMANQVDALSSASNISHGVNTNTGLVGKINDMINQNQLQPIGNVNVTIDGNTVATMQHAQDFFTKIQQEVRRL